MPIIKFVSFSTFGQLKLVLAGNCPNCHDGHIRNTCNIRYCNEVIDPILKEKFNKFKHSSPILTHDTNLESIVNSVGGNIKYPISVKKKQNFREQENFMFHVHPDIYMHVSMLSLRKKLDKAYSPNENVSMQEIVKKYKFMYIMNESSKLVCADGELINGLEIPGCQHKLPKGFKFEVLDNGFILLKCTGVPFFNSKNYVVIEF